MSTTLVLSVGFDSSVLTNDPQWKSSGFILTETTCVREAVDRFYLGDYDLLLLGSEIPLKEKDRLTCLIRASGSRAPVIYISDGSGNRSTFADVTFEKDPGLLLHTMRKLIGRVTRMRSSQEDVYGYAN